MFWNNFVSLCNKQGMSPNAVAAKLGFGKSAVTYWKNGTIPNGKSLAKIAEFFEIAVDDLLSAKKSLCRSTIRQRRLLLTHSPE